jgi:hypothetical protein
MKYKNLHISFKSARFLILTYVIHVDTKTMLMIWSSEFISALRIIPTIQIIFLKITNGYFFVRVLQVIPMF